MRFICVLYLQIQISVMDKDFNELDHQVQKANHYKTLVKILLLSPIAEAAELDDLSLSVLHELWSKGKTVKIVAKQLQLSENRIRKIHDTSMWRIIQTLNRFTERAIQAKKEIEEREDRIRAEKIAALKAKSEKWSAYTSDILLTSIDDMPDLSVRAFNMLKILKIEVLGEIVELKPNQLLNNRNVGKKTIAEIEEVLQKYGLHFGMDLSKYQPPDLPES